MTEQDQLTNPETPKQFTEEEIREIFRQRRAPLSENSEEWFREIAREEIWLALDRQRAERSNFVRLVT